MEISYRREIKHNYLVVTPDSQTTSGYEADMLSASEIRGLMPMHIRYKDSRLYYYYDITSRQPLSRLLETRFITRDEICRILIQIHVALMGMEGYLLSDGGILLNPELIYVEPELFEVGLCLVPGHRGDFPEQLSRFLQYLLKCVNHKDRECVVLAYGMYQESLKDNYGVDDILKFISPAGDRGAGAGLGEWPDREEKKGRVDDEQAGRNVRTVQEDRPCRNGSTVQEEQTGCQEQIRQVGHKFKKGIRQEKNGNGHGEPELAADGRGRLIAKQIGSWLAVVLLLPVALWLLKGINVLQAFSRSLICLDIGLLLVIAAVDIVLWLFGRDKKNKGPESGIKSRVYQEDGTSEDPWRILYEDEEEPDPLAEDNCTIMGKDAFHRNDNERLPSELSGASPCSPCLTSDETFQTTLLAGQVQDEEVRRLRPIGDIGEEIALSYFPFVIGKNKNLVDYVLQMDTVSRFHLRIDENGSRYSVTDLNSTNGTRIRDKLLDANETAVIEIGDEIYIADAGYIFS